MTMILPELFISRTQAILQDEWGDFSQALEETPPVSIRANNKSNVAQTTAVPWCSAGYYLDERPSFTLDPLFHAGTYYVQEASSMFVQQALEQYVSPKSVVLDLCAAPGGKSTLISQYLGADGFLVSNEIVRSRAHVLSENLQKWGNGNACVTNNRPSDIGTLTHFFDAILVDAPCSGEGMFRKDPNAINEWSVPNVELCATRQREILSDVWDALKPGGTLIYSTCTYNREENEDTVAWIMQELGASYQELKVDPAWGITDSGLGYHFFPHKTRGEGFFLAVMCKDDDVTTEVKLKKKEIVKTISCPADVQAWIQDYDKYAYYATDTQLNMYPAQYADKVHVLLCRLNTLLVGTEIYKVKGKNKIPQQGLALSKQVNQNNFITFEAELELALSFLRAEAIYLPDCPLGYILIRYEGVPLGWVKNVGGRCNNLYPNEWRIRKR